MARVTAKAKPQSSEDITPKAREPFDLTALANGGPQIEVVTEGDRPIPLYEDPAFLNEVLEIRFLDTGDANAPKLVELFVGTIGADGKTGGKNVRLAFARGEVYKIPRYVFEVIAHAKTTKLEQVRDPRDPMNIMHVERHSFYYPVECLKDPNPKGAAWRQKVLSDPA